MIERQRDSVKKKQREREREVSDEREREREQEIAMKRLTESRRSSFSTNHKCIRMIGFIPFHSGIVGRITVSFEGSSKQPGRELCRPLASSATEWEQGTLSSGPRSGGSCLIMPSPPLSSAGHDSAVVTTAI